MEFHRRRRGDNTTSSDDGFVTSQFTSSLIADKQQKIPYKSILLAVALFTIGSVLLIVGSLLVTGIIIPAEYADRTIPVLILGCIAFLPGSYHTYIAWASYRQYEGYSYRQIPSYDD